MKYTPISQRKSSNQSTGGDIDSIMERIASVESAGASDPYKVRGPEVKTGMYAGERAMGRWQLMPGNLPSWSKEALGREVTEEEYLNDPKLQESIVRHQMEKNLQKYGNADDVASVWFTGRPVSQAQGAKDVTGTDVNEYVRRFNQGTPQLAQGGSMRYVPLRQRV